MFIKAKLVKLEVRENDMRCSKEFLEALSRKVHALIKVAVETAKLSKVKTVGAEHIS